MAVGPDAVVNAIVTTIEATEPLIYDGVGYLKSAGYGPLDEQMLQGKNTQRLFKVYPRQDMEPAWWNGSLAEVEQTFVVQMIYHTPVAVDNGDLALEMAGSDAARLTWALTMNFEVAQAPELTSIRALRSRPLRRLDNDVWLMELEFRASYFLGEETEAPEISP